jgi:hypothetical protein
VNDNNIHLDGGFQPIKVSLVGAEQYQNAQPIKIDHTLHGDFATPVKIDVTINKAFDLTAVAQADASKLTALLEVVKTMSVIPESEVAHMLLIGKGDVSEILLTAIKNIQIIVSRMC